jgi:hypothetical protein
MAFYDSCQHIRQRRTSGSSSGLTTPAVGGHPIARVEAARALAKLARRFRESVVSVFPALAQTHRPGVAWALAGAQVQVDKLLPALVDDDARQWVAYMIGWQDPN